VFGELFKAMAGVDLAHVPYRSSFYPDLLAGRVHVTFVPISAVIGYIPAGQLRVLAVTSSTRSEALPNVPTLGEFVPGYEASAWEGIGAPRGTPVEIIDKLNKEVNAALVDPKIKAYLENLGNPAMPMSPSDFGRFIVAETEKWGKVIRASDIRPE
jgi:tripartite-type tricarboxylate transporter receptor subunit TctC